MLNQISSFGSGGIDYYRQRETECVGEMEERFKGKTAPTNL